MIRWQVAQWLAWAALGVLAVLLPYLAPRLSTRPYWLTLFLAAIVALTLAAIGPAGDGP